MTPAAAIASMSPTAEPAIAIEVPCHTTSRVTSRRVAPRATRIPNSRRRCVTPYATTP
jgi:hypothetical protein